MIYHSIADYLDAKNKYLNVRWKLNSEGAFAFINGEWITEQEFSATNSKPRYEPPPSIDNPDGTHISSGIKPMKPR